MFAAGGMLLFLSVSGAILKFSYEVGDQRASEAVMARFLEYHCVDNSEHWVIVVDFTGSIANTSTENRDNNLTKMRMFVAGIKKVLLEDIPEDFAWPWIKLVPIEDSPWQQDIDDNNFDEVIDKPQVDELMWGVINDTSMSAKVFIALST
jgi:hypothetical protein